ncbi:MAG TPA: DUF4383 domain-containing protein [Pyrinomonadaceae bacterium]|jgi:hypothetical protein
MNKSISSVFAMIVGAFLIVEGLWGEFSNVVFGVLSTNRIHATIHILLGIVGIYTGLKGGSRGFCIFLGILLVAVGILRFVPAIGDLIVSILNVNPAVAYFNIVVGIVSLIAAFASNQSPARRN